jgi:hypothetical protein
VIYPFASVWHQLGTKSVTFYLNKLDAWGSVVQKIVLGTATEPDPDSGDFRIVASISDTGVHENEKVRLSAEAKAGEGDKEQKQEVPHGGTQTVQVDSLHTNWKENEYKIPRKEGEAVSEKEKGQPWKRQNDFNKVIKKEAEDEGVDPDLLKAIVALESGFNPKASSGSHFGLAQVPDTVFDAKTKDKDKFDDSTDETAGNKNLEQGAKILKQKRNYWSSVSDQKERDGLAVSSYRAGEGTIKKAREKTGEGDPGDRQNGYSRDGLKRAVDEVFRKKDQKWRDDFVKDVWNYTSKVFGGTDYSEKDDQGNYKRYKGLVEWDATNNTWSVRK